VIVDAATLEKLLRDLLERQQAAVDSATISKVVASEWQKHKGGMDFDDFIMCYNEIMAAPKSNGAPKANGVAATPTAAAASTSAPPDGFVQDLKNKVTEARSGHAMHSDEYVLGKKLSHDEFCALVREREGHDTQAHLDAIFEAYKGDDGMVDMVHYLEFSLHVAMCETHERAVDLFEMWDHHHTGTINLSDFTQALQQLGFQVPPIVIKRTFEALDTEHTGLLKYAQLAHMLELQAGEEATKRSILRAPVQPDHESRAAAVIAKNVNCNYVVARVHTLPVGVSLDPTSDVPMSEQLGMLLTLHHGTIVKLFQEWDLDGNGGVDLKEFRKGLGLLGVKGKHKSVIDTLFHELGHNSHFIEFDDLKKALHQYVHAAYAPKKKASNSPLRQLEDDVASGKRLSHDEFCALVRQREGHDTQAHLDAIFEEYKSADGKVDLAHYLEYSLHEAICHTHQRFVDVFEAWDEDKSGTIDETEFAHACMMMGLGVPPSVCHQLFRLLCKENHETDGKLRYKDLALALEKQAGEGRTKRQLLRAPEKVERGDAHHLDRQSAVIAKNQNKNYCVARVHALPPTAHLEKTDDHTVVEQLGLLLTMHQQTVVKLFTDWDIDGDGGVDFKEFSRALAALGFKAKKAEYKELFDSLDTDKDNMIEFEEMKEALRHQVHRSHHNMSGKTKAAPAPPPGPRPTDASPRKIS